MLPKQDAPRLTCHKPLTNHGTKSAGVCRANIRKKDARRSGATERVAKEAGKDAPSPPPLQLQGKTVWRCGEEFIYYICNNDTRVGGGRARGKNQDQNVKSKGLRSSKLHQKQSTYDDHKRTKSNDSIKHNPPRGIVTVAPQA